MTGNRPADEDVILLRKDLHYFQAFHLYAIATHPARHANATHNPRSIGRVTQRTRSTLPVMLTMRLRTDAMKSMTLNDTLKTFTFRSTYDLYLITFRKDVHGNRVT